MSQYYELADDDGIWFIHVRRPLSDEVYRAVVAEVRRAAKDDDISSIIVTIPDWDKDLNSARGRYRFEQDLVSAGGQLLFVEYDTMEYMHQAEAKMRREFRAQVDSVLAVNHESWPKEESE